MVADRQPICTTNQWLRLRLAVVQAPQKVLGGRIVASDPEGLLGGEAGLIETAGVGQDLGAGAWNLRVGGRQRRGPGQRFERLVDLAGGAPGHSKIVPGAGVFRVQFDRFLQRLQGGVLLARFGQRQAELEPVVARIGFQAAQLPAIPPPLRLSILIDSTLAPGRSGAAARMGPTSPPNAGARQRPPVVFGPWQIGPADTARRVGLR